MVVQSIFTTGPPGVVQPGMGGKKSTAQPRPTLHVPPRGIGPIVEPNENDVLCGRGGRINAHEGNVQFRDIIQSHKKEYLAKSTKKLEKAHIAARIIEQIRTMDPPGRFLKEDGNSGMWFDIGDAKAIKKAGQALREDAPDIRHGIDSGDEAASSANPKKTSTKTKSSKPRTHSSGASKSGGRSVASGMSAYGMLQQKQQFMDPAQAAAYQQLLQQQQLQQQKQQQQQLQQMNPQNNTRMYGTPGQLYENVRSRIKGESSTMSQHAMEIMGSSGQDVEEAAFGRNFTPTEISSGSTISGLSSNFSAIDSNLMAASAVSGVSALSMGSALSLGSMQRPAKRQAPAISNLTQNFMATSGLPRSPSFGDLSISGSMKEPPLSDASIVAMMQAENKEVNDTVKGWAMQQQLHTTSASVRSSRSKTSRSGMSVASIGSVMSTESSWLKGYQGKTNNGIAGWDER